MADSVFSDLLIQTCDITRTSDGESNTYGIPAQTVSTVKSGAICLIQQSPRGDVEVERKGQKVMASHVGFFEYNEDILENDIVVQGSNSFLVLTVLDAAGQEHHKECDLKELQ